jgi:hypothetical protein
MKYDIRIAILIIILGISAGPATSQESDEFNLDLDLSGDSTDKTEPQKDTNKLVLFAITGPETVSDLIPLVNAELFMVLNQIQKYEVTSSEELAKDSIMPPEESLAFCEENPTCIADIAAPINASWILYGDLKKSFDGSRILLHLVLINVAQKKIEQEEYGQYPQESNVVESSGIQLLKLFKLYTEPKKKEVVQIIEKLPDEAEKEEKKVKAIKKPAPEEPFLKPPWDNPLIWTAAGFSLATLTVGTILGINSLDKSDAARAVPSQSEAYSLFQEAKDLSTGANIAFVVGGVALSATIVYIVLEYTKLDNNTHLAPAIQCGANGCMGLVLTRF